MPSDLPAGRVCFQVGAYDVGTELRKGEGLYLPVKNRNLKRCQIWKTGLIYSIYLYRSLPCWSPNFLNHTALGLLWRILQERNIPPHPSHLEEPRKTSYTASINATVSHHPSVLSDWLSAGNGRRVKLVLYSQPPQNDPPRLLLQTRGPHMHQFAGLRPKKA